MAYSRDLRQRVLAASDGALSNRQVAELFQVSKGTVERWRRQRRETGQFSAGQSTGRPRTIPPEQEDRLRAQVQAQPDATLVDHCRQWAATTGAEVSPATMCRALQRLGWTLKKAPDGQRAGSRAATRLVGGDAAARSRAVGLCR